MSSFDPFKATFDEARAQPDALEIRGAVHKWAGAQKLLANRAFYEANPLDGMAVCAVDDLVAPEWLAVAFLRRFRSAAHGYVRSWDEAFGPPLPKGTNLANWRRARFNRVRVANLFSNKMQREPMRPVDKELWEEIGKEIGEGATRAEELYREALRMGIGQTAEQIRRLLGWPVRPVKSRKLAGIRKKR